MSGYYYDSDNAQKTIESIEFDILGNDEIAKMSVMTQTHGVEVQDLYDKQEPKKGGLLDPRFGACGDMLCGACQFDEKHCDGHFGHIDLAEPVFHVLYMHHAKYILECICIGCSRILISKDSDYVKHILALKSTKSRVAKIHEMAIKAKYCANSSRAEYGCGMPVSKIRLDVKPKYSTIEMFAEIEVIDDDKKEKKKQRFTLYPDLIADIFDAISPEDRILLGFSGKRKPSDLICKIFPVSPVHIRPSLRGSFNSGMVAEDSLTLQQLEIVKSNIRIDKIKSEMGDVVSRYIKENLQFLQINVAACISDVITNPKTLSKGFEVKPLTERYDGKEGRFRWNLMGKRVDFNGRSVITPDPTLGENELGVPVQIAMNLTFREKVSPHNIERLSMLVKNGTDKYPGANFVYKRSSAAKGAIKPIYLKFRKDEITLKCGDVVERHLLDGDPVIFCRQPSLHKQSMMCFYVKVINDPNLLTFRFNLATTTAFNADRHPPSWSAISGCQNGWAMTILGKQYKLPHRYNRLVFRC